MKLDLTYDGKPYVFDTDQLSLAEAFSVKAICGLNAAAFIEAIFAIDPGAWLAMIVLALRRGGLAVLAEDIDQDKVEVNQLAAELTKSIQAAQAEAKAAAQE